MNYKYIIYMNIILFGSTGMLGNYIVNVLNKKYNLICISREEYDIYNGNYKELKEIIKTNNKDGESLVINCAGAIPQRYCEFKYLFKLNTWFPNMLSKICNKIGIKLIHITTDCVYNGKKGKYNEKDFHTETNMYGRSKSIGEPRNCCIIRTSIIGEENKNKKSLIEWLKSETGKEINGYVNHYWNGVTCYQLSKIIKYMIEQNLYWHGIRHIFTPLKYTKYNLCVLINNIYDLNIKINKTTTSKNIDRTLSTNYEENKIFKIPDLTKQILEQKEFWNSI